MRRCGRRAKKAIITALAMERRSDCLPGSIMSRLNGRLTPGERWREVRKGGETFGCRFYDFMARFSPCEALKGTLRVCLLDERDAPMPDAPYRLRAGGVVRTGFASGEGVLVEENFPIGPKAFLEWGTSEPAPRVSPGPSEGALPPEEGGGGDPGAHLLLAVAAGSDGAEKPTDTLLRLVKDGLFPMYAGLIPSEQRHKCTWIAGRSAEPIAAISWGSWKIGLQRARHDLTRVCQSATHGTSSESPSSSGSSPKPAVKSPS
jgi:hypothetical protein